VSMRCFNLYRGVLAVAHEVALTATAGALWIAGDA